MRVEEGKVADDDGNRKGDGENPHEGAQGSDEHAQVGLRRHVTVADRRHGNYGPPESDGDGCEVVLRVVLGPLCIEDKGREDDDAENKKEDKQTKFVCTGLERVYEDLEPGRVPGQLEQPHDSDDAEELESIVLPLQPRQKEVEVEGERRHEVDDVDGRSKEDQLIATDEKPNDELERKPSVADALYVEKRQMRFSALLLERPSVVTRRCGRHDRLVGIARGGGGEGVES